MSGCSKHQHVMLTSGDHPIFLSQEDVLLKKGGFYLFVSFCGYHIFRQASNIRTQAAAR